MESTGKVADMFKEHRSDVKLTRNTTSEDSAWPLPYVAPMGALASLIAREKHENVC